MADSEAAPLTYVPETVLKKRKDDEQAAIRRKEQAEAQKLGRKENQKLQFKRAEQFIKEYRLQHLKTKKILYLLRLRKIFNGVFIILNNKIAKMLKIVEPYVTYGYPNLRSVKELIFKKGVGWINKERALLTDNSIIEKAFGNYGIICIEDLVHEIASVGSHFKEGSSFLQPFKLSAPDGGLQRIRRHFKDGGDTGNREDLINDLFWKMN